MTKEITVLLDDSTYAMLDALRVMIARDTHATVPVSDATVIAALLQAAYTTWKGKHGGR